MKARTKERKIKRLYNQLKKHDQQPESRPATDIVSIANDGSSIRNYANGSHVFTRKGKIMFKIVTLENTK